MANLSGTILLERHVQALYVHDERGRITGINQWNGGQAPRFYLGRSPQGNLWRFRADLPDALCSALERACRKETAASTEAPHDEAVYRHLLAGHAPVGAAWSGPAYVFTHPPSTPGICVPIDATNAYLLEAELGEWVPDIPYRQPMFARVVDGIAVAICASVRITPAVHEAGVETAPAYRRRGYATQVVSAWAYTVAAQGVLPLYSTSWENQASQGVADRLGLSLYGVDYQLA